MPVLEWLLDADPSIRWQAMRDLADEPAEAVSAERSKVATEGWGARLLALQGSDGQWGGGTYFPEWTSTTNSLALLRQMGLDPASEEARRAVALVRDNARWEYDNLRFFDGEVEPCINGQAVAIGAYFGQDVKGIVDRLLHDQMADGGWNCEQERGSVRGSFDSTINVLEGLLEYEGAVGGNHEVEAARMRGQEYLVERGLVRRLSTGELIEPNTGDWYHFSFPSRWHYDVLRGLDHLRTAGVVPDERLAEALDLVEKRRGEDGRWPAHNPYGGQVHFDLDAAEGEPSRWNTLHAMRVLRWAGRAPG